MLKKNLSAVDFVPFLKNMGQFENKFQGGCIASVGWNLLLQDTDWNSRGHLIFDRINKNKSEELFRRAEEETRHRSVGVGVLLQDIGFCLLQLHLAPTMTTKHLVEFVYCNYI